MNQSFNSFRTNSYDTQVMCPLISAEGHKIINSVNDTVEIRYPVSRLWIVQQDFDDISFPHATRDIFPELCGNPTPFKPDPLE